MAPRRSANAGSALAMLILILVGLVGGFIFIAGNLVPSKKLALRAADQSSFAAINEALVRFVQVNKRLPCPANGAANPQTGAEERPSDTACGYPAGVVPWTDLGLPKSAATDSHGRLYAYRVYAGATGFTRTDGLNLSNCLDSDSLVVYALSGPGSPATCNATTHENTRSDFFESKGLSVSDRGSVKAKVAYALISHGATGYGAYTSTDPPTQLTLPNASSKEFLNAGSLGTYWILDPSASTIGVDDAAHYDDEVSYRLAADIVAAAKIGGRPWPLYTHFGRLNATGFAAPATGNVNTGVSTRKIAMTGGPVMVGAFATGSTRYISSMPVGAYYGIGAMTTSGGGGQLTTSNSEGLTFDFRVKRRFLKVTLANFNIVAEAERAQLTFYDDTTQVAQLTKQACSGTGTSAAFTVDVGTAYGKEFTKVDVQALSRLGVSATSNFIVASIAACQYDDAAHPACTLPLQSGETAISCP